MVFWLKKKEKNATLEFIQKDSDQAYSFLLRDH
jgi:hypothetical protein